MAESDHASEDEPQKRVNRGGYGMLHDYCFKPAIEEAINQTADVFPEQVLRGTYKAAEIAAVLETFDVTVKPMLSEFILPSCKKMALKTIKSSRNAARDSRMQLSSCASQLTTPRVCLNISSPQFAI